MTDRLQSQATRWRSRHHGWKEKLRLPQWFAPLWLAVGVLLMLAPFRAHGAPDQLAPTRKNMLPKRVYNAVRLAGPPPRIDGKLDDPCWTQGDCRATSSSASRTKASQDRSRPS